MSVEKETDPLISVASKIPRPLYEKILDYAHNERKNRGKSVSVSSVIRQALENLLQA